MPRVLVFVLAVAAMVALVWWRSGPEPLPAGSGEASASASSRAATAASAFAPARTVSTAPRPLVRRRQPRDLAVAWLRGYLTRSSRDDDGWASAIADLSSPELVDELRASGPDRVGLNRLSSWRVARVEAVSGVDLPVDTSSRVTLSYAAFVTDGRSTIEKPFTLYCYRQADNRWLVGAIDLPYSSEG